MHVEAVGNLSGLGRTLARTLSKRAITVATDCSDGWVCFEPTREARRGLVRQHLDGLAAFQVNNERAVGAPFAKREVVHADDLGRWWRWQGCAALEAHQGGGTRGHAECCHARDTCRPTHRKGQLL